MLGWAPDSLDVTPAKAGAPSRTRPRLSLGMTTMAGFYLDGTDPRDMAGTRGSGKVCFTSSYTVKFVKFEQSKGTRRGRI